MLARIQKTKLHNGKAKLDAQFEWEKVQKERNFTKAHEEILGEMQIDLPKISEIKITAASELAGPEI